MAYYAYTIRVGIFEVTVQAESWTEAIKKCVDSELFAKHEIQPTESIKCIRVRQITGKDK